MHFFKNFPKVTYKFGTEASTVAFSDLTAYVDIIDQIKDEIGFYTYYEIYEGERPDHISSRFYNTPNYYWTFYLLNDKLRDQGWPLSNTQILAKANREYPDIVLTTRTNISADTNLVVGGVIEGGTSGTIGTVIHRDINLGQITVRSDNTWQAGESIIFRSTGGTIITVCTLHASSKEINATHHYVDGNEDYADIDPLSGPGAGITPVTNLDFLYNENDKLKSIKVIKPAIINDVVSSFKNALKA